MLDGLTIARNIEGKICISPDFCLTEEKFEKCQGILENLDGESTNNSSISNTCTPKTLEGKQIFEFKITYSEPFKFDGECLTQVKKIFKNYNYNSNYKYSNIIIINILLFKKVITF